MVRPPSDARKIGAPISIYIDSPVASSCENTSTSSSTSGATAGLVAQGVAARPRRSLATKGGGLNVK